ncbi:MAG TPA: hypothetical protein VFA11_02790 [Acidimicrobiales bacterium]|nr:hypothetical protein [Acidimicrobiales bacterium]
MSNADEHPVLIERRGSAFRASCPCGWRGHPWNELRPAEADAWHHVYGDERVVDVEAARAQVASHVSAAATSVSVERLVHAARDQARGSSPHSPAAVEELARTAERSPQVIAEARDKILDLLQRHSRQNAGAADGEWLELHTARRLLDAALARVEDRVAP